MGIESDCKNKELCGWGKSDSVKEYDFQPQNGEIFRGYFQNFLQGAVDDSL